jgi:hypothetical protein
MTKLIAAAPVAPARKNIENATLTGYVVSSGIFIAAVLGLFTVAGFPL